MPATTFTPDQAADLVASEALEFIFDRGAEMVALWEQLGFRGGVRRDLAAKVCAMPGFDLSTRPQLLVFSFAFPDAFRPVDTPVGLVVPRLDLERHKSGFSVAAARLSFVLSRDDIEPDGFLDVTGYLFPSKGRPRPLLEIVEAFRGRTVGRLLADNRGYASGQVSRADMLAYSPVCPHPFRSRSRWLKGAPGWRAAELHFEMMERLLSPFPAYGVEGVVEHDLAAAAKRRDEVRRWRSPDWLRFGDAPVSVAGVAS